MAAALPVLPGVLHWFVATGFVSGNQGPRDELGRIPRSCFSVVFFLRAGDSATIKSNLLLRRLTIVLTHGPQTLAVLPARANSSESASPSLDRWGWQLYRP